MPQKSRPERIPSGSEPFRYPRRNDWLNELMKPSGRVEAAEPEPLTEARLMSIITDVHAAIGPPEANRLLIAPKTRTVFRKKFHRLDKIAAKPDRNRLPRGMR